MNSSLRPDETASLSEIERSKNKDKLLKKGVSTAIGLGTAAAGVGLSSKILPFLNEFIPKDLALKGISKLSPQLGNFLKKGIDQGLDLKEGLDFIKQKMTASQDQKPPEQKNIIAQYDDKLHSFIDNLIKQGRSALEAGALARTSGKFEKSISKMEKDHKTNFSSIIESVYGQGQPQQTQPAQTQMQQPQQSQGQGIDPQLMQLMQGIRSSIQNIRGR
jgi:hypothetical protein